MTTTIDETIQEAPPEEAPAEEARACRECGCTEATACVIGDEPCSWVEDDLCSACADEAAEPDPRYDDLGDEASRLVAYRDALTTELEDASQLITVRAPWSLLEQAKALLDGIEEFEDEGLNQALADWREAYALLPTEPRGGGAFADELQDLRVIALGVLFQTVRHTPFPPASVHHATVRTPAKIDVDGVCPDCYEVTPLSVALDTKYVNDGQKHEMHLSAKGTKGSHTHGQMAMAVTDDRAAGQRSMEDVLEGEAVRVDDEEAADEGPEDDVDGDDPDDVVDVPHHFRRSTEDATACSECDADEYDQTVHIGAAEGDEEGGEEA